MYLLSRWKNYAKGLAHQLQGWTSVQHWTSILRLTHTRHCWVSHCHSLSDKAFWLDYFINVYFSSCVAFFLLTTAIIKNHNLQATAPATTSLIPALGTGMRILAQASFATGVRVMGEIGRVLDGTGEKETTHRKNLLYLMQSVSSILVPSQPLHQR